jgi:hypothetical protein
VRRLRRRRVDALALAVIVGLVALYYAPQLLFGTVQFDGVDVHYSAQKYLSDEIRGGQLPVWTPYIFSGFPFLADLQTAAWYPLHWPFFLLGISDKSLMLELAMHTLIACVGTYWLARRLLISAGNGGNVAVALGAVGAALFYGLSGYFAAHAQHVGISEAAAWLPWVVLYLHVAAADGLSLRRLALGGLLGAAIALPGHFQVALYTLCGAGLWALVESRSRVRLRRTVVALCAVGVWGAFLSAVMILPALELVGQSVRTQLDARSVDVGYFHPAALLTLVWPDFYGLLSGAYRGPGDVTQHYFYAGMLLVPLAVIGAVRSPRILSTAALLGLPFLWYALGPVGGLFRVLVRLPGFASVELPMHGWFLPALGLALLGGAGLARIGRVEGSQVVGFGRLRIGSRGGRQLGGAPLAAGAIALTFFDVLYFNQLRDPLAYARQSFDALYGEPLAIFADRLARANPPVGRLYGPPLSTVGYRNHPLQSRVPATYGYNPLELRGYAEYAEIAEENPRLVDGFAANARLDPDGTIAALPTALPEAYVVQRVVSVPDEAALREALTTLDPVGASIVVGTPPELADVIVPRADATVVQPSVVGCAAGGTAADRVSVLDRADAAIALRVATGCTALVRVAIPAYPGWRARLDGQDADLPIVTLDGAFIGIVVPPADGALRLTYMPRYFGAGVIVSAIALAACLVALAVGRRRAT